jgi:hypothetical protein
MEGVGTDFKRDEREEEKQNNKVEQSQSSRQELFWVKSRLKSSGVFTEMKNGWLWN